jgi:hypothetical protein
VGSGGRRKREARTLEAMALIFCRGTHGTSGSLCPECTELLEYALARLDKCRFKEEKPVCGQCPVHCYKPAMRERIRQVMRYAGPRLMFRRPGLALLHLADTRRFRPR